MKTSKKFLTSLNLFCIICVCYINADEIRVAGENDKCATFCDDLYSKETELDKQSKESCKQGCRLFSLIQLTNSDLAFNETNTREKCSGFCTEAYPNNLQARDACSKGCANQTVFKSGAMEVHMDGSSPLFEKISKDFVSPAIDMMKKFQQIFDSPKNWFNSDDGIFNRFSSIFKDGTLQQPNFIDQLSFGGADSIDSGESFEFPRLIGGSEDVGKLPSGSESADKSSFESVSSADGFNRKMLKNLADQFAGPQVGNSDEQGEPVIVVHMIPANPNLQIFDTSSSSAENHNDEDSTLLKETAHEPSPPLQYSSEDDWFACLSRRVRHLSMITRWMLCVALLLSITSMIWICLAIIRTAPRRRLSYLGAIQKGGIDNVYYTTPPVTASDKSPMIIKTCDFKAQPEAPPPYEPEISEVKIHQLKNQEKEQA